MTDKEFVSRIDRANAKLIEQRQMADAIVRDLLPSIAALRVREAIASMPHSEEVEGWQPIETAPKDGTHILSWGYPHDDGGPYYADLQSFMGEMPQTLIVAWRDGMWTSRMGGGSYDGLTHWRHLPEAPALTRNVSDKE